MFAALDGYKEQSYYDQYPQMLLITPESAYTVELFSGYVTGTDGQAWQTVFSDEEAFVQWLGFVADCFLYTSPCLECSAGKYIRGSVMPGSIVSIQSQ